MNLINKNRRSSFPQILICSGLACVVFSKQIFHFFTTLWKKFTTYGKWILDYKHRYQKRFAEVLGTKSKYAPFVHVVMGTGCTLLNVMVFICKMLVPLICKHKLIRCFQNAFLWKYAWSKISSAICSNAAGVFALFELIICRIWNDCYLHNLTSLECQCFWYHNHLIRFFGYLNCQKNVRVHTSYPKLPQRNVMLHAASVCWILCYLYFIFIFTCCNIWFRMFLVYFLSLLNSLNWHLFLYQLLDYSALILLISHLKIHT